MRREDVREPARRGRDGVDFVIRDVGFSLTLGLAFGGAAAQREQGVLRGDVAGQSEEEEGEADEPSQGFWEGDATRRRRGGFGACMVDEPACDARGIRKLEHGHQSCHAGVDGTHAGGEEERGDDGAVGVVQHVEGGEEFVAGGQAGAEDAGAGVGGRVEFRGEGEDDEEHVERADGFGDAPGVAAGEVEAGCCGRLAHVLEVAHGSP